MRTTRGLFTNRTSELFKGIATSQMSKNVVTLAGALVYSNVSFAKFDHILQISTIRALHPAYHVSFVHKFVVIGWELSLLHEATDKGILGLRECHEPVQNI